jgi:PIN domain nuclease of toxin-antitoxin system
VTAPGVYTQGAAGEWEPLAFTARRRRAGQATQTPAVEAVLDASAILALVFGEAGAHDVQKVLPASACSAVNWAEVLQQGVARRIDTAGLLEDFDALGMTVVDFTGERAARAAALYPAGRRLGLSLGDRACLALAAELGVPALTTDDRWTQLPDGPPIHLIRPPAGP